MSKRKRKRTSPPVKYALAVSNGRDLYENIELLGPTFKDAAADALVLLKNLNLRARKSRQYWIVSITPFIDFP